MYFLGALGPDPDCPLTEASVAPLSPPEFIRRILALKVALWFIKEDRSAHNKN